MSTNWDSIAHDYWGAQPHPLAPSLTQSEFPVAVKLATATKFGGHATPQQAELFWQEFKNLDMSPDQYTQALDTLAPLSFAYHNRPPTMNEIKALGTAKPAEIRKHYTDLPDKDIPTVSAGDMVKAIQTAKPHFHENLGRMPTKLEAAYLVHSGQSAVDYARQLGAASKGAGQDGTQTGTQPNAGGGGPDPSGGQAADQ